MKKVLLAAIVLAGIASATEIPAPGSPLPPPPPPPGTQPFDDVRIIDGREFQVREFSDSLRRLDSAAWAAAREEWQTRWAEQRAIDSAAWADRIPDSIRTRMDIRRNEWENHVREFRALPPEVVKARVDSLRSIWEARRAEEIAKLPAEVQEKIKARIAAAEVRHEEMKARIEARRAEIAKKIAEREAAEGVTPPAAPAVPTTETP